MIKKDQRGQILILTFVALGVVLFIVLFIIAGSQVYFQNAQYSYRSESAMAIAEAGVDKALASLNKTPGTYNGEETLFGEGMYSVEITNKDAATKILQVTGYLPDKSNPKATKRITVQASSGTGISFNYGAQVGEGGLNMQNNAIINGSGGANGSVYSNGNITMSNGSIITGDAYVAGGTQPTADQQSDCFGANCQHYIFGKNEGGENRRDVAQSFQPSTTSVLNKVSLKLKKVGSPSNPTVRIMGDASGKPNKNNVITSGILNAGLVTGNYGFVDVTFSFTPNLTVNTTYWIMIHANSLDNNNYWVWSLDLAQGYTRGVPKWSSNWQASNPVWTAISGDLGFQTYMGGITTSIIGSNNAVISGNAHANLLQSLTINKDAYYQTIINSIVSGSSCPNSHCYPNSPDPVPQPMPISDANIQVWKDEALAGGTLIGDITSCPSTLTKKKYEGNITTTNGCTTTIESPIWITGNLDLSNNAVMKLNSSYGASSGVIIVDGIIKLSNNSRLLGSGTTGSYLVGLSTYDSRSNDNTAIETDNGSSSMILYAGNGKILVHNNASMKEVTAWKLFLDNGASVTYDSGLAGLFFSSGPSGAYSLIKGTYQVK